MFIISRVFQYVYPMLYIACGIAIIMRFRGSITLALGGIAPQRNANISPHRDANMALQRDVNNEGIAPQRNVNMPPQRNVNTDHISSLIPYLILLYSGLGAVVIGFLATLAESEVGLVLIILGILPLVVAAVYAWVVLYQLWRFAINESRRNSLVPSIQTPGQAVGYAFIPFYNFYWIFQLYGKLPGDLNMIARTKGVHGRMSEGLGIAIPVLTIVGVIPFVGYVTGLVTAGIMIPIFLSQAVRTCESLRVGVAVTAPGSGV